MRGTKAYNLYYCPKCNKEVTTDVVPMEETIYVKTVPITSTNPVRICHHCRAEIWDSELDNKTLENAYREYEKITGKSVKED